MWPDLAGCLRVAGLVLRVLPPCRPSRPSHDLLFPFLRAGSRCNRSHQINHELRHLSSVRQSHDDMTALKRPVVKAERLKSNQAGHVAMSRISSESSGVASLSEANVAVARPSILNLTKPGTDLPFGLVPQCGRSRSRSPGHDIAAICVALSNTCHVTPCRSRSTQRRTKRNTYKICAITRYALTTCRQPFHATNSTNQSCVGECKLMCTTPGNQVKTVSVAKSVLIPREATSRINARFPSLHARV